MKPISRRALLAASATALAAQTPPAPVQPAAQGDGKASDLLNSARKEQKEASVALEKFDIPMSTEPAAHFRA